MKTCQELLDFLGDYIAGDLPAAQCAEFERHLAMCPPCVAFLQSYEQTIKLGKKCACADEEEKPPEELIKAILAARSKKA